jgi:hypothetical protein
VALPTKKKLHCLAIETRNRLGLVVETNLLYMHGDDIANVRYLYRLTQPNTQKYHIVAIAPVIGFHVDDKQGNQLSV